MLIGIDIGGTFTDLVAIDDRGVATLAKVPSTPDDPSRGVIDGLERLAELRQPFEHAARGIVRGRRHLGERRHAAVVDRD